MGCHEDLKEIAGRLRQLQRTSPTTRAGLAAWDLDGRAFLKWFDAQPAAVDLPEQVWHYLYDADIRIKDPERRAEQDEMLNEIITSLERGVVPDSVGTTMSFHPRWLGAIALLSIAVIAYWISR